MWRWTQSRLTVRRGASSGRSGLAALLSVAAGCRRLSGRASPDSGRAAGIAERGQQAQKLEALGQLTGGIAHDFNNLLTACVGSARLPASSGPPRRAAAPASRQRAPRPKAGGKLLTAQLLAFSRCQELSDRDGRRPRAWLACIAWPNCSTSRWAPTIASRLNIAGGRAIPVEIDRQSARIWRCSTWSSRARRHARPGGLRITASEEGSTSMATARIRASDRSVVSRDRPGRRDGRDARAARATRTLLHHQDARPRHRAWPCTGVWADGAVGRIGRNRQRDRTRHDGDLAPARGAPKSPTPRSRASEVVDPRIKLVAPLLVDDDARSARRSRRQFEDDGHVVDLVGDGRIALTAIEHCRYDLAIVDFAMPVMDGAARDPRGRKLRPELKSLMITGYSDSEAVSSACPDTPVIRKPFDGETCAARWRS